MADADLATRKRVEHLDSGDDTFIVYCYASERNPASHFLQYNIRISNADMAKHKIIEAKVNRHKERTASVPNSQWIYVNSSRHIPPEHMIRLKREPTGLPRITENYVFVDSVVEDASSSETDDDDGPVVATRRPLPRTLEEWNVQSLADMAAEPADWGKLEAQMRSNERRWKEPLSLVQSGQAQPMVHDDQPTRIIDWKATRVIKWNATPLPRQFGVLDLDADTDDADIPELEPVPVVKKETTLQRQLHDLVLETPPVPIMPVRLAELTTKSNGDASVHAKSSDDTADDDMPELEVVPGVKKEEEKNGEMVFATSLSFASWMAHAAGIKSTHAPLLDHGPLLARMIPIETRMPNNKEPSDDDEDDLPPLVPSSHPGYQMLGVRMASLFALLQQPDTSPAHYRAIGADTYIVSVLLKHINNDDERVTKK